MDPKDFISAATGRVVRTVLGYHTFIPAILPDEMPLGRELELALSLADAALGELSGLGRYLPNPELLIAPYVKREAIASSRIEGTQADLSELLLDELSPELTAPGSDVIEVRNYIAALRVGMEKLNKLPLAVRLVRQLHKVLMRDVRGQERTPGEFRRTQNWIGPPGSTPSTAPYVPPPVEEMHDCLKHWEIFVNGRGKMPELVQCALMHAQLEAIHPFLDGNGRVGRLLIPLFLIERGRLSQPLLYLSSFIEAHRRDYYEVLQRTRTHGDWTSWLLYFLTGVTHSARAAIRQSDALLSLRKRFRDELEGRHSAQALVDELFVNPYVSVARAAQSLKVSPPTAWKAIMLLTKLGVLKETTGRSWGRVWVAGPILSAIETPPPEGKVK